jgi:NAD(P)H dehydrogenase (quinone)
MILVAYDSITGNTEEMAKAVANGAIEAGIQATVKKIDRTTFDDLQEAKGIIFGTPTHFGGMTSRMMAFIEKSNDIWGKLDKKIGAAFTSSGSISGGHETALLSLIQAMLIHGMLVASPRGKYGVVSIGKPDKATLKKCVTLGRRVATLVKQLP